MKSLKSTSTIFLFFFLTLNCFAQPFITTWKTNNDGTSDSTSITIPTHPNETYNYDVDWDNDGVFDEFGITGDVTHDFGVAGTYTIAIQGNFPRIYFNDSLDKEKILQINQWGNNVWTSMEKAFYGCKNLNSPIVDAPNLSTVTDMSYMFADAHSFNQPVDSWDVSNVTDMSYMFLYTAFNQPVDSWNVSNVTNMSYMFSGTLFNQDISLWNVSNVTDMSYMFSYTAFFNQNISSWDVSSVTDMSGMFYGADYFNQPLNAWNVSNVTDMSFMLSGSLFQSSDFNQPLDTWDVSNVTNMSFMFWNAIFFNQDISSWNVSNVTDMSNMFRSSGFNQDISSWDISNVTNMSGMFSASAFNQSLDAWDVSNVTSMGGMFALSYAFNQPLDSWNVSNVTNMSVMFQGGVFNQPLDTWNVDNVTDMIYMFAGATAFDQSLATWNVGNVTDMTGMLSGSGLSIFNYDNTLIGWESQGITDKSLGAVGLKYCDADSVRNNLINLKGWTITGDTIDDISCKTVATTPFNTIDVFEIYPNPTNGLFFINAEFEKPINNIQIEIINTNGQVVKQIQLGSHIDLIQETINLSSFPKGSYYVRIRSDEEQVGEMILLN